MSFLLKMQEVHRKKEEKGREGGKAASSDLDSRDDSDAESEVNHSSLDQIIDSHNSS